MSEHMDPELEDILRDPELLRLAGLLSNARTPEPPLDDAFRSALRRQLMEKAWDTAEGRSSWWRRLASPPGMAWVGAAAVVVLIASVVVYTSLQQPGGGLQQVIAVSPLNNGSAVALQQPIVVSFNQPMDHSSTEAAVRIVPATTVTFAWNGDTTLLVQPASGDLAPNTQYQVTIATTAQTQAGKKLDTPKTFTFVTQPTATPTPPPSPTPANPSLLTNVVQLATIPNGTYYTPQWSADSATIYVVGAKGALEAVPAQGGPAKTLVADGVSLPAIAPAGDRIAYMRAGLIEVLTLASGATSEMQVTPQPTALSWVKDRLLWGTNEGVHTTVSGAPPVTLTSIPGTHEATAILSIAPDGAHAVYASDHSLLLLDLSNGSTVQLGGVGASTTFQGWSPNGSRVIYGGGVIADMSGKTVSAVHSTDVSWSASGEVLLGGDTELDQVRPDGSAFTRLAVGTFGSPVWAPDSSTFFFLRSGALWSASAPPPAQQPSPLSKASSIVNQFMKARLSSDSTTASSFLDDAGKAAYAGGNPSLIPSTQVFKRFYILTAEMDPSKANTARFVVRLVFANDNKVDRTAIEETLTLTRAQATDPFLIDGVSATPQRDLGKGPDVVAVKITSAEIAITFDSDLVVTTASNVSIQDSQGLVIAGTMTYADRTVTFSGLQLTPGERYRVVVLPGVQDVSGRHPVAEYDLDLIGPAPDSTSGAVNPTPGPSPEPSPTPAPQATPSANPTSSPSPTAIPAA